MPNRRNDHCPSGDGPGHREILAPGELLELAAFAHAGRAAENKGYGSSRRRRTYGQSDWACLSRRPWRSTAGSSSTNRSALVRPRRSARSSARCAKRASQDQGRHGGTPIPRLCVLPRGGRRGDQLAGESGATKLMNSPSVWRETAADLGEAIATSEVRPTLANEAIVGQIHGQIAKSRRLFAVELGQRPTTWRGRASWSGAE